jgi:hypothetical protein
MATPKQVIVQGPKDVLVEIGLDPQKNITVKPDPFKVSKKKEQQVVWKCTLNHEHGAGGVPCFTVDFNANEGMLDLKQHRSGTPFSNWHFCGHGAASGPAIVTPDETKLYKYTVSMNGNSLDPKGGVDP